ncbi:MAG: ParB/RepB/Spo0J family partition protein [Actinomycetota bacterium]
MSRRTGGLGRGLGSLIPNDVDAAGSEFLDLPIDQVDPNPYQPRRHFDEEAIDSLTASIRELGVLQPILVRRAADGDRYELIAGERRWRCARRAGLTHVPAVIRQIDDVTSLAEAVVENIQRQDLNPLEEAAAYRQLIEDFELTHDELATRVGRSRASVTNSLRLLQLPAPVQRHIVDGLLASGHAKVLLGVSDRDEQVALANQVVAEGWSVRHLEARLRSTEDDEPDAVGAAVDPGRASTTVTELREPPPAGVLELEELLSERLSTSVAVRLGVSGRGQIGIEFADVADLERIARLMIVPPDDGPASDRRAQPST